MRRFISKGHKQGLEIVEKRLKEIRSIPYIGIKKPYQMPFFISFESQENGIDIDAKPHDSELSHWIKQHQKNEEIRFPISKEFGFLFSLPFLTWRYNGSHKYPKEIT